MEDKVEWYITAESELFGKPHRKPVAGPFASREEAEEAKERLKDEFPGARISRVEYD